MPLGSRHGESGVLLWEGRWLVLMGPGGGRWRLDGPRRLSKLVGQRVRIEGVRSGFDLLDVKHFEAI